MEKSEYHQLLERRRHLDDAVPTIQADGFPEGTLLYGYTIERCTFHVYVRDGEIHALTYDNLSFGGQPGMVIFVCNGASLRTMIRVGSAAEAMRRLTLEGNPGEEDSFSADESGRVIVRRDAVVQVEPRGDGVSRVYIKGDREWRCPIESPLSVGEIMRRICE